MSGKPTSACKSSVSIEHLEQAGWSNAELIWEQVQEEAARLWLQGEKEEARELWQGALEVAESCFRPPDPRLVTSRVNAAAVPREAAAEEWAAAGPWVEKLRPSIRARSSMFHFRLRDKHPGGYDGPDRDAHRRLFHQGLSRLQGQDRVPFEDRVAQWTKTKPPGFNDLRKLMAAALLLR